MSDKPVIVDGIKVDITIEDIDDIEVAEMLEEGRVTSAMKRIFGDEGYAGIKDALREKHGKAKLSDFMEWFNKVSERLGADAKN